MLNPPINFGCLYNKLVTIQCELVEASIVTLKLISWGTVKSIRLHAIRSSYHGLPTAITMFSGTLGDLFASVSDGELVSLHCRSSSIGTGVHISFSAWLLKY